MEPIRKTKVLTKYPIVPIDAKYTINQPTNSRTKPTRPGIGSGSPRLKDACTMRTTQKAVVNAIHKKRNGGRSHVLPFGKLQ